MIASQSASGWRVTVTKSLTPNKLATPPAAKTSVAKALPPASSALEMLNISGNVTSDQVIGQNLSVEALNGGTLTINGAAGKFGTGVTVNDANVIATDIIGSNGVIHVIDSVLLP